MILFRTIPDALYQRYESWKAIRSDWLDKAKKSKEYYYADIEGTGSNYTQEQVDKIKGSTNIPVSINFLYPIINRMLSIVAGPKPDIRVIPKDKRFIKQAIVIDKIKTNVFNDTSSVIETEEWIKESLITGCSIVAAVDDSFYNENDFNLNIKHVPNELIILDPNTNDRTLADMEGYFIEAEYTKAKAYHLYGDILEQIMDENGNPVPFESFLASDATTTIDNNFKVQTNQFNNEDKLKVRKYYEKVFSKMYYIRDVDGDIQRVFEENLTEEQKPLLTTAEKVIPGIYIKEYLMFGDYLIQIRVIGITEYNIGALFFEWGGRPYRSYGMVHFNQGSQEAYDKMIQMFILNGILSNNAGWTAPKGSIAPDDKKKWENEGGRPDAVKEFVPKVVDGHAFKPERDIINQLSSFYPTVLQTIQSSMEYSTGISQGVRGNAQEAGGPFDTAQQDQNNAMQRILLTSNHINRALEKLGKVVIELIINNLKPTTHISYLDKNGDINEVELSKEINESIKFAEYGVTVSPTTSLPTQDMNTASSLFNIAQSTPDPESRSLYVNKAVQLSGVKGVEDIAEQLDIVNQLKGRVDGLEEANQRLEELTKQMENKLINSEIALRIEKSVNDKTNKISEKYGEVKNELSNKTKKGDS